jgi:hypothetical protein
MEIALVKTLAHKYKISVRSIYRKYQGTRTVEEYTYKVLQVEVPTSKGTRSVVWGAIPLKVASTFDQPINDRRFRVG